MKKYLFTLTQVTNGIPATVTFEYDDYYNDGDLKSIGNGACLALEAIDKTKFWNFEYSEI